MDGAHIGRALRGSMSMSASSLRRRSGVCAPVTVRGAALIRAAIAVERRNAVDVDIDPGVGLKNLEAVLDLRERFKEEVSIQVVAFPQSGIVTSPGTSDLLDAAVGAGADLIGGLDPAGLTAT